MKHVIASILIVLFASGCAVVVDDPAPPVTGCPAGAPCIPVDPAQPGKVPFATTVSKSHNGAFSFLLDSGPGPGNTWLIFKCQIAVEQASDCRTPAADRQGNPLWAVKLNRGQLKSIKLGNDPVCNECLDQGRTNCAANACRYPWMVIDLNRPDQQPIDPIIIVVR